MSFCLEINCEVGFLSAILSRQDMHSNSPAFERGNARSPKDVDERRRGGRKLLLQAIFEAHRKACMKSIAEAIVPERRGAVRSATEGMEYSLNIRRK